MPLDFVIFSENGAPELSIPLPVHLHHELMQIIADMPECDQMRRFVKYYEDVDYSPVDLSGLKIQIVMLLRKVISHELRVFLERLDVMINTADEYQKTLFVLAD